MNKPKFELKPKIAVAIIPTIILALIVGFGFGLWVVPFYVSFHLRNGGAFTTGIVAWIIIALAIALLIIFFRIMNLKSRKYLFYSDEAVFYEGFLNIVQRNVPYNKITDFVLVKSIWDRMFGTGTIRLVTAGHEMIGRYSTGGGITLQYIENPDEVFMKLKSIMNKK